jgi:hypothetical protein
MLRLALSSVIAAALTVPAVAAAETVSPVEGAGKALMQCVAHTTNQGVISKESAALLASNGLLYSEDLPPFLQSARTTPYGSGSFATVPTAEGQVWAVGYDGPGTSCLVFVMGTAVAPVRARLEQLFAIPGAWVPQTPAPAEAGEQKLQYGWKLKKPGPNLTALVSIRDLPTHPAKGFVMVTISQTSEK